MPKATHKLSRLSSEIFVPRSDERAGNRVRTDDLLITNQMTPPRKYLVPREIHAIDAMKTMYNSFLVAPNGTKGGLLIPDN